MFDTCPDSCCHNEPECYFDAAGKEHHTTFCEDGEASCDCAAARMLVLYRAGHLTPPALPCRATTNEEYAEVRERGFDIRMDYEILLP